MIKVGRGEGRRPLVDLDSLAIRVVQDARRKAIEDIESDWTCAQCGLAGISQKELQCPSGCIL